MNKQKIKDEVFAEAVERLMEGKGSKTRMVFKDYNLDLCIKLTAKAIFEDIGKIEDEIRCPFCNTSKAGHDLGCDSWNEHMNYGLIQLRKKWCEK